MTQQENENEMVQKCVQQLGEHFESVQIFVTQLNADSITSISKGYGNWYTRYGHVRDWLNKVERDSLNEGGEK